MAEASPRGEGRVRGSGLGCEHGDTITGNVRELVSQHPDAQSPHAMDPMCGMAAAQSEILRERLC
ncbi:hypothetical protein GCM10023195_77550 [Actinoallomurus liliacearum]|uniref:Uncharacterized protein n=1 Tax=Actinoallomurus liliacearum TaxID=1080073 RepID=A0ABP8TZD5_9ACTN